MKRRSDPLGSARPGISATAILVVIGVVFSAYLIGIIETSTPSVIPTTTATQVRTAGTYTGTATLSNGSQRPLTGTWSGGSAQLAVIGAQLLAPDFQNSGSTTNFECASSPVTAYLALTNMGTASVSVRTVSLTWAGGHASYNPSGTCDIGAKGSATSTTYLTLPTTEIPLSASGGRTYTGMLTLSNGAQVLLAGAW